ncbi:MAG: GtrA family protein [Promethearchaeota archaeon]
MENNDNNNKQKINLFKDKKVQKQFLLYISFAICMIILNLIIQSLNDIIAPIICENYGYVQFIYIFYCSDTPIDMSNFIGTLLALGVTVIVKFLLDKLLVFKTMKKVKETSREFTIYLFFSILASLWNIGCQFILYQIIGIPWIISAIIGLGTGYLFRFFLDRKYTFKKFIVFED